MPSIFISYRREDSAGWTGRLAEHLRNKFGIESIFMDLDTIQPGADFAEALRSAVSSCNLVLAIIGPNWSTAKKADGQARLHAADDWVRIELATALSGNTRVIPVLVGSASMPRSQELPDDLKGLAGRQGYEISDKRWRFDCDHLVGTIEGDLKNTRLTVRVASTLRWVKPSYAAAFLGIAISVIVAIVIVRQTSSPWSRHSNLLSPSRQDSSQGIDSSSIALSAGQVVKLEEAPWSATYTILAVHLERDRPSGDTYHSFLKMKVRITANTAHSLSFWKEGFRLRVDGKPYAPTHVTEALVEGNSTKDGEVTFQLPDTGQVFVLELILGEKNARVPIEIPARS